MLIPTMRPPGLVGGGGATNSRKAQLTVQEATPAGFETFIDNNVIGTGHEFWTNVQTDGGDIRFFTDSALTNRIPVEVEAINVGAKTCRLWARLPSALSALDTIWVGYGSTGGPLSQPASDATYGAEEVYQDNVLRSHVPGIDLTGNISPTITGTAIGSGPNGGSARGFNTTHGVANTDAIDSNLNATYEPWTYIAWVYVEADGGTHKVFFSRTTNTMIRRNSGGGLEVRQTYAGTATWTGSTSIPLDTWTHVGVVLDSSDAANDPMIVINGSVDTLATDTNSSGSSTHASHNWWDGNNDANTAVTMDGLVAERMFRNAALTSAHIASLYSNQNAVGSFWSIAAGQAA